MLRIVLGVFVVILTLDVIFQDGALLQEVLKTELYLPFFIKLLILALVVGVIFLLYHSVIWEYFIQPPPAIIKTPLQLEKERIAQELAEAEQLIIKQADEEIVARKAEKQRIIEEEEAAKKKAEEEAAKEHKQSKMTRKDPTVVDYGQRKSRIEESGGSLEEPKRKWGVRGK